MPGSHPAGCAEHQLPPTFPVLLVEDNEINQEVAIGQLEDAEVFVDLAENGAEAVRMAGENDYDIVLMDMQMPVMDGIEATRILRSNLRFATLPIIAMTANALVSDREMCLQAGMNDHIAKPIDPDQLFGVLLRWIKRPDGDGAGVHEWAGVKAAANAAPRLDLAGGDPLDVGPKRRQQPGAPQAFDTGAVFNHCPAASSAGPGPSARRRSPRRRPDR